MRWVIRSTTQVSVCVLLYFHEFQVTLLRGAGASFHPCERRRPSFLFLLQRSPFGLLYHLCDVSEWLA